MRGVIPFFLFMLAGLHGFAQQPTNQINQADLDAVNTSEFLIRPFNIGYEGVEGTPFLFDNWSSGLIVMINNDSIGDYDLKYDIFEDQLVVLSKRNDQPMIPLQTVIRSFSLLDSIGIEHVFVNTHPDERQPEIKREGFFEVLYQGRMQLLKKHKKYFVKADFEGAYNSGKRYDEFRNEVSRYYLLKPGGTFIELKKGKKGILKSLDDDGTYAGIVKDNKLDLRNEKDLIQLIIVIDKEDVE
jgi:hypothetical protein